MASYFTPRNINAFLGGIAAYNELDRRIGAAKEAGSILRQRYNRYYYTKSLKKQFSKPLGASNTTALVRARSTRSRKMPMRRTYGRARRPMMRRRKVYRRRFSKKSRWQAKARRMVGNPRNYSTSKTTESVLPGDVFSTPRSSCSANALIIINGTTTNSINDRQRDTCVVSGIKVNVAFQNISAARLWINWAIVHGKQGQAPGPSATDLFRDYTNQRAWDASATNKTGLSWSVAQINTDEYVVMKRGKFMLTPNTGAGNDLRFNYGASVKDLACYVKLGRQFYFDDGSNTPQDQVYFLTWCANSNEDVGNAIGDGMSYRIRSIVYFREPKQG